LQDFGTGEFEEVAGIKGPRELLQRRYFNRLWVVQELILSPRVVIRVGEIDFESDGGTSGDLWAGHSESSWVTYAARGSPLDIDLPTMTQLTFAMGCADPRDRVFGIMAIMSDKNWYAEPDYSLPIRHVYIGLAAHLLIVNDMAHLLASGRDIPNILSLPSWVPDWSSWHRWRDYFTALHVNSYLPVYRSMLTWSTDLICAYRAPVPKEEALAIFRLPSAYQMDVGCYQSAALAVVAETGALVARMVRLAVLDSVPQAIRELSTASISPPLRGTLFETQCGDHKIYLTSRHRLDLAVQAGTDFVYLFVTNRESRLLGICILRKDTSSELRHHFRIVTICDVAIFRFSGPSRACLPCIPTFGENINLESYASYDIIWDKKQASFDCVTNWPGVGDVYWTLWEVIERVRTWLDDALDPEEQLFFLPRWSATHRDLLNIYWATVLDADQLIIADLPGFYREYAKKDLAAELLDREIIFTVPEHVFLTLCKTHQQGAGRKLWWGVHWYLDVTTSTGSRRRRLPGRLRAPPDIARIAIDIDIIADGLQQSIGLQILRMVRWAARRTGESEEQLMSRKPTEADRFVRVPTSYRAERLMDECGYDGTVENIMIV
jgi:hypothetical protein